MITPPKVTPVDPQLLVPLITVIPNFLNIKFWISTIFPIYHTSLVNRISEHLLPLIMKLWISETSVISWGNPIDPVYRPATRFGVPFFVKIDNKRVHSSPFLISRFVFGSVTSLPQVVITVPSDFHGYCWSTHFKHLVFIPLEFAWFHNFKHNMLFL